MIESRIQAYREIESNILDCNYCAVREHCTPVPGTGHLHADIMFVGQNPGKDENTQGKPFVGAAGQWMNRIIKAIGHERNDVYITNAIKCLTPDNRFPTPEEFTNCMRWLIQEVNLVNPKVIIPLGGAALQTVLLSPSDIRISEWHGQRTFCNVEPFKDKIIFPLYHPAYLIYSYNRNYVPYKYDIIELIDLLIELKIVTPHTDNWKENFEF